MERKLMVNPLFKELEDFSSSSVYFTFLIPSMGNTGYIVKFIRRCTLYLTLIPFHHVCINKGFTVCKKH